MRRSAATASSTTSVSDRLPDRSDASAAATEPANCGPGACRNLTLIAAADSAGQGQVGVGSSPSVSSRFHGTSSSTGRPAGHAIVKRSRSAGEAPVNDSHTALNASSGITAAAT
jgi:hypothetical protein